MTILNVVVDLQFGSTGKGALAYLLGEFLRPDTVVTAWGPNAGHTCETCHGKRYVHTQLANSMICPSVGMQLIGPGSVVNMTMLLTETATAGRELMEGKTIIIHPNACILTPQHAQSEKELVRIGSTMKGTAAALVDKMWRDAKESPLARDMSHYDLEMWVAGFREVGVTLVINETIYNTRLDLAKSVLIEGAQGFSLGVHTHFWPHTTSRDVSTNQLMADCRIPFKLAQKAVVWGTARTFPIRVANRFNEAGEQIGTSGGHYDDQRELDWQRDLSREPELTTVTKLPRRIFTFSIKQIQAATRVCSPQFVALTFCDYLQGDTKIGTRVNADIADLIYEIRERTGARVRLLTFGPALTQSFIVDDDYTLRWLTDKNFVTKVLGKWA